MTTTNDHGIAYLCSAAMVYCVYVQHSLMNNGVASSLANHKVSPLDDNDRDEKCCVTRKLQHLALSVRLHEQQRLTLADSSIIIAIIM